MSKLIAIVWGKRLLFTSWEIALGKRWWWRPWEFDGGARFSKWKWARTFRSGRGFNSSDSLNSSSTSFDPKAMASRNDCRINKGIHQVRTVLAIIGSGDGYRRSSIYRVDRRAPARRNAFWGVNAGIDAIKERLRIKAKSWIEKRMRPEDVRADWFTLLGTFLIQRVCTDLVILQT